MNILKEGINYNMKNYTTYFINVYQKSISVIVNHFRFSILHSLLSITMNHFRFLMVHRYLHCGLFSIFGAINIQYCRLLLIPY